MGKRDWGYGFLGVLGLGFVCRRVAMGGSGFSGSDWQAKFSILCVCIYICIHTHTHTFGVYIYIYILRPERLSRVPV